MSEVSFALAMLILGMVLGAGMMYFLMPRPQQKKIDWKILIGREVDYESRTVKSFSKYGRRVRDWTSHQRGRVKEVKGKSVNIDNHWYKISEVRLIGGG